MIFLLVAGALIAGAPILAVVLVSIASLREDAGRTLGGRPPGALAAAARRLLAARAGGLSVDDHNAVSNVPPIAGPAPAEARLPTVPAQRFADPERADYLVAAPRP